MQRYETMMGTTNRQPRTGFPRHQTIEFAPTPQRIRGSRSEYPAISEYEPDPAPMASINLPTSDLSECPRLTLTVGLSLISVLQGSIRRASLGRHYTINTQNTTHTAQTQRTQRTTPSAKHRGFGGFPMPFTLLGAAMNKFFPKLKRRLSRTITIPITTSLVSARVGQEAPPDAKAVPYISFSAIVGRNSRFHFLSNDQLEEIGGVEYRALNSLLWLVPSVSLIYFLTLPGGLELMPPSFSTTLEYISFLSLSLGLICQRPNGEASSSHQIKYDLCRMYGTSTNTENNKTLRLRHFRFSMFQVVSSFSNTGTSLVDQSMIPFQKAYPLVVFQIILILGGNCAYVSEFPYPWFLTTY